MNYVKGIVMATCLTMCIPMYAFSQHHYVTVYDKLADSFSYYERTFNRGLSTDRPIKKPSVEHGDIVTFRIVNVNEFLFNVESSKGLNIERETTPFNPILSIAAGFSPVLGMASSGINNVDSYLGNMSRSRGGESAGESNAVLKKYEAVETSMYDVAQSMKPLQSAIQVLLSPDKTLEEVREDYQKAGNAFDLSAYNQACEEMQNAYMELTAIQDAGSANASRYSKLVENYKNLSRTVNKLKPVMETDLDAVLAAQDFIYETSHDIDLRDNNGSQNPLDISSVEFLIKFQSMSTGYDSLSVLTNGKLEVESGSYSPPNIIRVINRRVEFNVKGSMRPSWSAGFYMTSPFGGRKSYVETQDYFGDSLTITESSEKSWMPSIGTQIVFEFNQERNWVPHASLGVSVGLPSADDDFKPVNILFGGGVRPQKFRFLSLNGGIAFCQTKKLKEGLPINTSIPVPSENNSSNLENTFAPGLYFGLNLNF